MESSCALNPNSLINSQPFDLFYVDYLGKSFITPIESPQLVTDAISKAIDGHIGHKQPMGIDLLFRKALIACTNLKIDQIDTEVVTHENFIQECQQSLDLVYSVPEALDEFIFVQERFVNILRRNIKPKPKAQTKTSIKARPNLKVIEHNEVYDPNTTKAPVDFKTRVPQKPMHLATPEKRLEVKQKMYDVRKNYLDSNGYKDKRRKRKNRRIGKQINDLLDRTYINLDTVHIQLEEMLNKGEC